MIRTAAVLLTLVSFASAEEALAPIRDNSFFIEEAYNQESGVVQHVLFSPMLVTRDYGGKAVDFESGFTQEWPIWGMEHQLSYTIPFVWERFEPRNGRTEREYGIGDLLINYRYQLLDGTKGPAVSPRLSVLLPTGEREFRADRGGLQFNLPVSLDAGTLLTFHANAGASWIPNDREDLDVGRSKPRDLFSGFAGASVIVHALRRVDFMLEVLWEREESIDDAGRVASSHIGIVVPGVRWAIDIEGGTQIVLGLGVPIGVTREAPDWGVCLYVSLEHFFRKQK